MKKSILCILLALLPLLASAEPIEINGIWYNLIPEGNAAEVTNPNFDFDIGSAWFSGSCEIPASVTHGGVTYSVTSIGSWAFSDCSGLTSVTIPNSVTSIGDYAFYGCSGLTSVTIPNSVTSIGDYAFYGCSGLTSVTIPNSVTSIGGSAFSGTVWYNNQPDGLVYAGKVAYKYKGTMPSNTSLSIKEGTLDIAGDAFRECSGLTSITIPNSVTSIGDNAFTFCTGLTSVTIPSSVTSIGYAAFQYCRGLTSVTIPNSVTSIGESAFNGCSGLTSVTILNSETSIGNGAFSGCNFETAHIHINDIASWCENGNFLSCRELHLYKNGEEIKDLVIPDGVTSIRSNAFKGCSGLTSITIPNSVTNIGSNAFSYCSGLTSVTIPNSVKSIGDGAFDGCSGLTSVTIPNSVTSTGNQAFKGCSGLTSITIPNSVTNIGSNAFSYCSGLTSVTIPNSVTSIGESAFNGCSGLTTLKIGKGVTSIGSYAFGHCTNLSDVYCYAEEFPSSSYYGIFNNTPINNAALYIPAIHQSKYQSTSPWSSFKYILLLEGATAERCAKPTISLKDGEIIFESETPDASFVSSYEALNSSTTEGNKMTLPNRFRITVFAQKYGLLDSPAATAEVEMSLGKFGDLTGDGQVNAADHVKLSEIIMKQ